MLGQVHPYSKALYEQDGRGYVRVTSKGKTGVFRADGTWVEGDLYEADPQFCGWIAGPKVAHHRVHHGET